MRRVLRKRHLSRVGLAGSSGRKVTVRPRSAPGERPWRISTCKGRWVGRYPTPSHHKKGKALRDSLKQARRRGDAPLPPGQVA